ncbi:MAG: formate dehydrogenase accessory sulfurtransferase FdhD [Proteobacteria bacterium]|nr:formate dehydrogenase accessory sulfurtransferase FdhD [Pseudomonadota bacterium]
MHTTSERPVQRYTRGVITHVTDTVAEEVPVALVYQGVPHVVMLASPADLEDFAVGFTVSEGLVANASEVLEVRVEPGEHAVDVHLRIAPARFSALLQQRRNLTGRTGCGLCGAETLEQALRPVAAVQAGAPIDVEELHAALRELSSRQPLNAQTGSVHAAGWVSAGVGLICVREDVGRHNALDKTLGALLRAGADLNSGYMLITSRASFEMVQKSATAGVSLLAAVSAPTGLAISVAEKTGMGLIGFARAGQHVVYAHPERLKER